MQFLLFRLCLGCALCGALAVLAADDQEVIPHRQDRPPNKPYSPQEALKRMTVPDRFHVDLVASEPDIVNPIAMTFDDRGRIFITESVEYPRKSAGPGRDRVKVIDGVDDQGHARKVTVFAEGLNIPTGVAVGYGGVWVLNAPDLLFLGEKDGKEISREVVLTGFGRTDTHELPSSLTWGPDGWLYGLNGVFNQSHVVSKDGKRHDFTCAMWRYHPRTGDFQVFAQGTSNPYGIAWDAEGSAIIEACHWANDHLFHFVETGYYTRQAGAYPPFTMKIGSITDHSHQKTAYCGIAILDTDMFPAAYRQRVCVGNIHGGCINMDRLERDGATYIAKAEPDLLTANDAWFMPVSLKVGPDGCLYILDWHDRYHCSQDAARDPDGVDRLRGRLYRLRYGDSPRAAQLDLATESDQQLVTRLSGPNIYFRETAQRLLAERLTTARTDPKSLGSALEKQTLDRKASRTARLHALWALIGGGSIDSSFHERLLSDADPGFRAWAVRAAGNQGKVAPQIRDRVVALAGDPSPDVQLQVAIASRKIEGLNALTVLVDVLQHCGQDKLMPAIVWPNLHPLLETDATRLAALLNRPDPADGLAPAVATLMPRMIERILSARNPNFEAVAALLEYTSKADPARTADCIAAVSAKVGGLSDDAVARLSKRIAPLIEQILADPRSTRLRPSAQLLAARLKIGALDAAEVRRKFLSDSESQAARLQALDALIAFQDASILDSLPKVLSSSTPEFATRVLAALGRLEDPKLADVILAQYPKLAPQLQPLAIDLIMQREPWARKLLDAVLADKLPRGVLNANHLRKIMDSNDREAIWAVEKAFGKVREERNPEREKVVAEMGQYLRKNIGDPLAGQRVFKTLCAQCHTIYGEGGKVGPDITANGRASFDQLLSNVFDPSLVIGQPYQVVTVVTRDGRNLTGLIAEDNEQRVVVKLPGEGEEAVPRSDVKYTRVSKLSMMPEGIETLLAKKELADLFAFLSLDKPPTDPGAKPIPGAPPIAATRPSRADARIKVERAEQRLNVRARVPGRADWVDLATFVMDPTLRPHLHPLRDPSGRIVLTEDRPADHPWQHGIFTGFHRVNGINYWKEDEGKQHFVRLLDPKEAADRVSWRALVELVAPDGNVVLEEEDAITFHAPTTADAYLIDFDLLLRAKARDVNFGKFFVGGLAVRMPWDKANPRQTHLNSEGLRGRDCEQKRAAWCNVERPFAGNETFGIVIFDHPDNPNHPSGWRADEQGLINPNVSALGDWTIPAGKERVFQYRIEVYRGVATREKLAEEFKSFVDESHREAPARP
jgi:putative heme-binding domain-containing protein